jgi:hypothetical protein
MEALEREVRELRAERGDTWLNERRTEQVKALVRDVLMDADTRASLADDGLTAGHNGSAFFLSSADGSFLLKIGGHIQARYVLNSRDDSDGAIDDFESGLQMRRVKVGFEGHVTAGPKIEFAILLAANRDSGVLELEDAIIAHQLTDDIRLWGGQFMNKFAREQITSSKRQLTVDRSAVANIFAANDGYVQGFGVEWAAAPDLLKLALTINDGMNSGTAGGAGLGFQNRGNDFHNDAADFALTARADLKLAGDWKQSADMVSWANASELQLFLGAALHYEVGETGDGNTSATTTQTGPYDNFLQWTVDGLVKYQGLSIMGAVYGWHFDAAGGNPLGDLDCYAATAQVSYMIIPDTLEPFVRYEWISVDDALDTNDLNIVTAGLNYYLKGHNAKLTADVVVVLDNVNGLNTLGTGLTGIGILPDAGDEDGQVVGRVQFQLLF